MGVSVLSEHGANQEGVHEVSLHTRFLTDGFFGIAKIFATFSTSGSAAGREIYCGVEGSAAHIIEMSSGDTIRRVKGAKQIIGSNYTPHQLVVQRGKYLVLGKHEFEIFPLSFGCLDAAFSPEAVCISEPQNALHPVEQVGGTRLFDLVSGQELWHLDLDSVHLAFNSFDGRYYCVARARMEPYHWSLIRLGANVLNCDQVLALGGSWEQAFTPSGRVLVTVQGGVYETSTGAKLTHLDFPQREYPDA